MIKYYLQGKLIKIKKAVKPQFNHRSGKHWKETTLIIDGKTFTGYYDSIRGTNIFYEHNGDWYKFNFNNVELSEQNIIQSY